jgi:hypothetical protein
MHFTKWQRNYIHQNRSSGIQWSQRWTRIELPVTFLRLPDVLFWFIVWTLLHCSVNAKIMHFCHRPINDIPANSSITSSDSIQDIWTLYLELESGFHYNRFNPVTCLFLSEDRTWIPYVICHSLLCFHRVKVRGDCSFYWYRWNCWLSLFKRSFHKAV